MEHVHCDEGGTRDGVVAVASAGWSMAESQNKVRLKLCYPSARCGFADHGLDSSISVHGLCYLSLHTIIDIEH